MGAVKRFLIWSLILLCAGGWLLSGGREGFTGMGQEKTYTGTQPELHVTFQYPETWPLHEEQGKLERYQLVRIMGPRNAEGTYTARLSAQGRPRKSAGGQYDSAEELAGHYQQHLLPEAKILAEQRTTVAGVPAIDLTVEYTSPAIHHKGLRAVAVPVRERKIFFEKAAYLYELSYTADAGEYDRSAAAFDQLLQSFRVQDTPSP